MHSNHSRVAPAIVAQVENDGVDQYADHPMDLEDASLAAMAEAENLHKIFTIDRRDFATYHIKRCHRLRTFELIEPARMRKK